MFKFDNKFKNDEKNNFILQMTTRSKSIRNGFTCRVYTNENLLMTQVVETLTHPTTSWMAKFTSLSQKVSMHAFLSINNVSAQLMFGGIRFGVHHKQIDDKFMSSNKYNLLSRLHT